MSPFLLECAKQGKTGRFEVFRIERIQPSDDVAARLDIPAGPGCLRYRVTAPA